MKMRLFLSLFGLLWIAGCGSNDPSIENPVKPTDTASMTIETAAAEKTNVCHFDENGDSTVVAVSNSALPRFLANGDCITTAPKGTPGCSCSAASIVSFTATPDTVDVNSNESSTLSWSTTDATNCSIDQGVGSVPCNGSAVVTPSATTVYTLTATGFVGGPDTSQATVNIQYCAPISATRPSGPYLCPSGATKFCLPVPIDRNSSTHAQNACVACSGGACSDLDVLGGKAWFGGESLYFYVNATGLTDCLPHECFDIASAGQVISASCVCYNGATWAFSY